MRLHFTDIEIFKMPVSARTMYPVYFDRISQQEVGHTPYQKG